MFNDSEIIHRYTRADAIRDGVLIDVTEAAKVHGFRYPVAITSAAHAATNVKTGLGRVLLALRGAIGRMTEERDSIPFTVNDSTRDQRLYAVCGPGDDGEPVITVMLVGED